MRNRMFVVMSIVALFVLPGLGMTNHVHALELKLHDISLYTTHCPYDQASTALGGTILMGNWDRFGYPNLIPGSAMFGINPDAIQNAAASTCYLNDYAMYGGVKDDAGTIIPDMSSLNPSGAHTDNSMADFMQTARSALGLVYNQTLISRITTGISDYASWRGYSGAFAVTRYAAANWNTMVNELKHGRVILLDDGKVIFGCRDINGYNELEYSYSVYQGEPQYGWTRFTTLSAFGMTIVKPKAVSFETTFNSTIGSWGIAGSWSDGVPNGAASIYIPATSTVIINTAAQAGMINNFGKIIVNQELSANALRNQGRIEQTTGQVNVATSLTVSDDYWDDLPRNSYILSGGTLTVGDRLIAKSSGRFEWQGGQFNVSTIEIDKQGVFATGQNLTLGSGGYQITAVDNGIMEVVAGATVTQSPELAKIDRLVLGTDQGAGTYVHPVGASFNGHYLYVGDRDRGTFHQHGGDVVVPGIQGYDLGGVHLGLQANGDGYYQMDAGALTTYQIEVGIKGLGSFVQNGGTVIASSKIFLGTQSTGYGTYKLNDGELSTGYFKLLNGSNFHQRGGTFTVSDGGEFLVSGIYNMDGGHLIVKNQQFRSSVKFRQTNGLVEAESVAVDNGSYQLLGGDLRVHYGITIGNTSSINMLFSQSGGTAQANILEVGSGQALQTNGAAIYNTISVGSQNLHGSDARMILSGGSVQANTVKVGFDGYEGLRYREMRISGPASMTFGKWIVANEYDSPATLAIDDANAQITITEEFRLGNFATFTAVPGTVIHMTGSQFINTMQFAAKGEGLANLTLVFEGGAMVLDTLEIASQNLGDNLAAFQNNFAMGELRIGGNSGVGRVQLVDQYDNNLNWAGTEALYVEFLILNSGAYLDLNGKTIYYQHLINQGGTIVLNGGAMVLVPEPASLLGLILLTGLGLLKRRTLRRRF